MARALQTSPRQPDGGEHHKPGLRDLLRTIGLDVEYERAAGNLLYYRAAESQEVEVLDLVAGYGTLLLGHNHPQLIAAATRFLTSERPNHTQGSLRPGAAKLAAELSARAGGDFCAVFANSGTEAVEAAIKHAMLETGGRTFIVLDGAFHGKTAGSFQLSGNPRFRTGADNSGLNVIRVQPNDVNQLRAAFAGNDDLAGFLFEPIQGEAGIRPLRAEFIQLAAHLSDQAGIPLIADECQTGLGRTGTFLTSHALGVHPDYIILAKGLGGGLAKISALLVERQRYRPAFDLIHSSTFADDEFSCKIALKALELLDASTIRNFDSQGEYLLQKIQKLQRQFPTVLADVRGTGLLIGIELQRPTQDSGFLLNHLADRDLLGPLVSACLLREHRIRIAPTLSDSFTLRVQPAATVTRNQLDRFVDAMTDVCDKLSRCDLAGFTRFLTNPNSVPSASAKTIQYLPTAEQQIAAFHPHTFQQEESRQRDAAKSPCRRVAWVFHFIDQGDLVHLESGFDELSSSERSAFLDRFAPLAQPVVMDGVDIHSATGERVRLYPIVLPVTSAWLLHNSRGRRNRAARQLVQSAINTAAALNCDIAALGQFTSTVTRGGRNLDNNNLNITTGNNYTSALVVQAVQTALRERRLDSRELTLAVVGATGDIGGTCAAMLAADFRRCILVGSGRAGSRHRLRQLANQLPGGEAATDMSRINHADVVLCATNSITAPIGPEHLHPQAIVCDVSIPSNIQPLTADLLPDVTVIPGAVARLPCNENLRIPGFPLPSGFTYGCMAEALLLGLEGATSQAAAGSSTQQAAIQMASLAARHGFTLANRIHTEMPPSIEKSKLLLQEH